MNKSNDNKASDWKVSKIILIFVFSVVVVLTTCFVGIKVMPKMLENTVYLEDKIVEHCKVNNEMKLSEFTDFEWDTAYIDQQYNASGEKIKKKYNLKGEFKRFDWDEQHYGFRLAFYKNERLVEDLIINRSLEIDSKTDIIKPDAVFDIWDYTFKSPPYIVLTPVSNVTNKKTEEIRDYCKTRKEIKLSEFTDFDWDLAEYDGGYYSDSTGLNLDDDKEQEKCFIEKSFKFLSGFSIDNIGFYKDDKLINGFAMNRTRIEIIKYSGETILGDIKPDTVFSVSWEPSKYTDEKRLILTSKE